jgi:hypothetical protein
MPEERNGAANPDSTETNWGLNYFNYFTEIERQFQQSRGTGLFLLSPVDWALIETWKDGGIPLEAVLRGIETAFQKWRAQKKRGRMVNSLTYCVQAVIEEAERMAGNEPATGAAVPAPFTLEELSEHLERTADLVRAAVIDELAGVVASLEESLRDVAAHYRDLESLEQRLSGLEDKMIAVARTRQSEAELAAMRAELDGQLRPYRGKMTAPQLAMLEKQYLDRAVLEHSKLPRLSLFYLR